MSPQPFLNAPPNEEKWWFLDRSRDGYGKTNGAWKDGDEPFWTYSPYGQPGDRLWVRETFLLVGGDSPNARVVYRASNDGPNAWVSPVWRPSIFMPRWASRITLEITKVRVERVQDINEEDAIAEGVEPYSMTEQDIADLQIGDGPPFEKELAKAMGPGAFSNKFTYQMLWDELNAKRGFGWDKSPWVWVIEFKQATSKPHV